MSGSIGSSYFNSHKTTGDYAKNSSFSKSVADQAASIFGNNDASAIQAELQTKEAERAQAEQVQANEVSQADAIQAEFSGVQEAVSSATAQYAAATQLATSLASEAASITIPALIEPQEEVRDENGNVIQEAVEGNAAEVQAAIEQKAALEAQAAAAQAAAVEAQNMVAELQASLVELQQAEQEKSDLDQETQAELEQLNTIIQDLNSQLLEMGTDIDKDGKAVAQEPMEPSEEPTALLDEAGNPVKDADGNEMFTRTQFNEETGKYETVQVTADGKVVKKDGKPSVVGEADKPVIEDIDGNGVRITNGDITSEYEIIKNEEGEVKLITHSGYDNEKMLDLYKGIDGKYKNGMYENTYYKDDDFEYNEETGQMTVKTDAQTDKYGWTIATQLFGIDGNDETLKAMRDMLTEAGNEFSEGGVLKGNELILPSAEQLLEFEKTLRDSGNTKAADALRKNFDLDNLPKKETEQALDDVDGIAGNRGAELDKAYDVIDGKFGNDKAQAVADAWNAEEIDDATAVGISAQERLIHPDWSEADNRTDDLAVDLVKVALDPNDPNYDEAVDALVLQLNGSMKGIGTNDSFLDTVFDQISKIEDEDARNALLYEIEQRYNAKYPHTLAHDIQSDQSFLGLGIGGKAKDKVDALNNARAAHEAKEAENNPETKSDAEDLNTVMSELDRQVLDAINNSDMESAKTAIKSCFEKYKNNPEIFERLCEKYPEIAKEFK